VIEQIEIKNFQSLQSVSLELSPFTVIVGQSSSGKSAFIRSLSTLISNRRGTDFISHGTTTSVITASLPQGKVSLSRSTTASKNKYTVIPPGKDPIAFTKLGGDTPPEVSSFMRMSPKDSVTLAQQFDKPYLLAEPPGQAAQALGSLTNVHVIFDSAREANRQRLSASQKLKTRREDLEGVEEKLTLFTDLDGLLAHIDVAEEWISKATRAEQRLSSLNGHIDTLRSTKAALVQAQAVLDRHVPDDTRIVELSSRRQELNRLIGDLRQASAQVKTAVSDLKSAEAEIESLEVEYTRALQDMGTCPTCLQKVS